MLRSIFRASEIKDEGNKSSGDNQRRASNGWRWSFARRGVRRPRAGECSLGGDLRGGQDRARRDLTGHAQRHPLHPRRAAALAGALPRADAHQNHPAQPRRPVDARCPDPAGVGAQQAVRVYWSGALDRLRRGAADLNRVPLHRRALLDRVARAGDTAGRGGAGCWDVRRVSGRRARADSHTRRERRREQRRAYRRRPPGDARALRRGVIHHSRQDGLESLAAAVFHGADDHRKPRVLVASGRGSGRAEWLAPPIAIRLARHWLHGRLLDRRGLLAVVPRADRLRGVRRRATALHSAAARALCLRCGCWTTASPGRRSPVARSSC